jgi:hypothetical protein
VDLGLESFVRYFLATLIAREVCSQSRRRLSRLALRLDGVRPLAKLFPDRMVGEHISGDAFVINVEDPSQLSCEAFERHFSNSTAPKSRWICQESRELSMSELTIYKKFSQAT